jgi:uncharacterized membrane protein (TIGR02234 family)
VLDALAPRGRGALGDRDGRDAAGRAVTAGRRGLAVGVLAAVAGGGIGYGALVLASGAMALTRGRRWAAMGARYDAPTGRETIGAKTGPDAPPTAMWDALDRGDDPTR